MNKKLMIGIIVMILIVCSGIVFAQGPCIIQQPFIWGEKRVYCPPDTLKAAVYRGTKENPQITIGKGTEATVFPVRIVKNGYIQVKEAGEWVYLINDGYVNSFVTADKEQGEYTTVDIYYNNLDVSKFPRAKDEIPVVSGAREAYYGAGLGSDYTWREGQINDIKYGELLGKSIDGYEYYEITEGPDGKGVLRVPPEGSEEKVAFYKIDLEDVRRIATEPDEAVQKAITDGEHGGKFHVVEKQDDPTTIFDDPEVRRGDITLPLLVVEEEEAPKPEEKPTEEIPSEKEQAAREAEAKRKNMEEETTNKLGAAKKELIAAEKEWLAADKKEDAEAMAAASKKIETTKEKIKTLETSLEQIKGAKKPVEKPKTTAEQTKEAGKAAEKYYLIVGGETLGVFGSADEAKKSKEYKEWQGTGLKIEIKKEAEVKVEVDKDKVELKQLGNYWVVLVGGKVVADESGRQKLTKEQADKLYNVENYKVVMQQYETTLKTKFPDAQIIGVKTEAGAETLIFKKGEEYFEFDGTKETKLGEGDEFVGKEKIGDNIYDASKKIEDGKLVVSAISGIDISDDPALLKTLQEQAGKTGKLVPRAEKLTIIDPKTNLVKFETGKIEDTRTSNYYEPMFGQAVKTRSVVTIKDTISEQTFEPIFYDSEKNIISQGSYSRLVNEKKAGEIKAFIASEVKYEGNDEQGNPVIKELVQYDSTYGLKYQQGKGIVGFRDKYIYDETGKFKEYVYIYDIDPATGLGKEIHFDAKGNAVAPEGVSADIIKSAESARKKASSRMTFSAIEYVLTEFSGLSAYSSLFFSKEDLKEWRDSVDRAFDNFILGGTDYWASELCESQYDKSIDGVSYAVTPSGMLEPAAHVEAERSAPITVGGSTQYLYKITFYVKAAEEDTVFNVFLYDGNKAVNLFSKDILLEGDEDGDGEEYSAVNEKAIVQYSANSYSKICIEFYAGDIPDACNRIAESDYSKDNYISSGSSGGSSAGTGVSGAEGAIINQI